MEFAFQDTMMMGADYYQTESEIASLLAEGKVPIGVGQNTKIRWDLIGLSPLSPGESLRND